MKKTQRLSLGFGLILTLLLLSACGANVGKEKPDASAGNSSPSVNQEQQSEATDTVVPNKTEISVYLQSRPESSSSNDSPWLKPIVERTNVYFNWVQSPTDANDYLEKFNLLLASGDIPDFMEGQVELLNRGGENGVFEPLNDLIDAHMPHFKQILADQPQLVKDISSDDGSIYFFPQISAVRTIGVQIYRQDWLDALGMDAPTTIDEVYEVLKAFKERDPNGNGEQDEIPFTTRNKLLGLNTFVEPFGISMEENFFVADGKVHFTYTDPRLKDALTFLHKLYQEGLIDKEYLTNDTNIWQARLSKEISGATFDTFPRVDFLDTLVLEGNPNVNFTGLIPLRGVNGEEPYTKSQQTLVKKGYAISSKSKYKTEIAQMQDWFYSPEGQLALDFGQEGLHYTMQNGEPQYTDLILKDPNYSPLIKMFEQGKREFARQWDIRYENAMVSPKLADIRDSITPYIHDRFPHTLSFTQDERDIINSKFTEITTYKDEMLNKFVMGGEPLDKFDDYVTNIERMGIKEVLEVQQAAYDRYLNR